MRRILRVIISIALLCVAFGGLVFFVWPAYQKFSALRHEIELRQDRLDRGQKALAQLRSVQEEIVMHEQDFAKIDQAIPQDPGLPGVYEHILQLAVTSGLVMQSISGAQQVGTSEDPDSLDQSQQAVVLSFQVTFSGSYEGLKTFLEAAKRSARILNVNTISIGSNSLDPGAMSIDMQLDAYATPQPL